MFVDTQMSMAAGTYTDESVGVLALFFVGVALTLVTNWLIAFYLTLKYATVRERILIMGALTILNVLSVAICLNLPIWNLR